MGMLMNFLGGAAKSLAGSIDQDRLEKKRIEDEQRQHEQQVSWAKAANAIRIAQEQASKPPEQRASGMPFAAGPGGFQQATEVATPVKFDKEGNVTEAAGWAPGPSVAVPAPVNKFKESKRVSGNDLVTYRVYEDGSEEEVARGPRASAGRGGGSSRAEVGEDGLTAYQREQLKRTDAREDRLSKQESKGGEKPENVRKLWDEEITRASELEGRALLSKAKQYGIGAPKPEGVGAAAPVDEDAIRNALLDKIDAKYGGRLKSSGVSGSAGANKPADKQVDAGMTLADALDYARKKAGGKLSPDVERKIRDAYGAD